LFTVTAVASGSTGNDSRIDFTQTNATTYTVAATKQDVYPGLTPASAMAALSGRPGLVAVKSSVGMPKDGQTPSYTNGTFTFVDANGTATALIVVTNGTTTDDALVTATVQVDPAGGTYTLTATWSKSVIVDTTQQTTTQAQADAINAALSYVVKLAPAGAGASGLPQDGKFFLSGGAEAAPAKQATLTALAQ
jgi:hypothetical protein